MNTLTHPKESSGPGKLPDPGRYTLPQLLLQRAQSAGDGKIAIREKMYGLWEETHWSFYLDRVKYVSLGLISLGLRRGERVAVMIDNCVEWLYAQHGAQAAGAAVFPFFAETTASEQVQAFTGTSATFIFAHNREQVEKLLSRKDQLSHVHQIIYIDPFGMRSYSDDPWMISFTQLLELGEELDQEQPELFEKEIQKGSAKDIALILPAPDAGGESEQVILTHEAIAHMARKWIGKASVKEGDNWFSISPSTSMVEQLWGMAVSPATGMTMNFPEAPETAMGDLREIGPHVIMADAEFWETLALKIRTKLDNSNCLKRAAHRVFQAIGTGVSSREAQSKPLPYLLKFAQCLAEPLYLRPILNRVGCLRVRSAFVEVNSLGPHSRDLLRANGIKLIEYRSLTEAEATSRAAPGQ